VDLLDRLGVRDDLLEDVEPRQRELPGGLEEKPGAGGPALGRPLEDGDVVAAPGEKRGDGGAGDAETDDRDAEGLPQSSAPRPRSRARS
jgi:hypothetical protein